MQDECCCAANAASDLDWLGSQQLPGNRGRAIGVRGLLRPRASDLDWLHSRRLSFDRKRAFSGPGRLLQSRALDLVWLGSALSPRDSDLERFVSVVGDQRCESSR